MKNILIAVVMIVSLAIPFDGCLADPFDFASVAGKKFIGGWDAPGSRGRLAASVEVKSIDEKFIDFVYRQDRGPHGGAGVERTIRSEVKTDSNGYPQFQFGETTKFAGTFQPDGRLKMELFYSGHLVEYFVPSP